METVSDRQKISGIIAKKGFRYQDIAVAHKFGIQLWDQVYYEGEGADYTREYHVKERDFNALIFVQCKTQSTGSYTLSTYMHEVLPTFSKIFQDYSKKPIGLSFFLETNASLQKGLKNFLDLCKRYDNNLVSPSMVTLRIGRSQFHLLSSRTGLQTANLLRFLRGLKYFPPHSQDEMVTEIISRFKDFFTIYKAFDKFMELLGIIYAKDQEIITRDELEQKMGIRFDRISGESNSIQRILNLEDMLHTKSSTTINEEIEREQMQIQIESELRNTTQFLATTEFSINEPVQKEKLTRAIEQTKNDIVFFKKNCDEISEMSTTIEEKEYENLRILRKSFEQKAIWERIQSKKD